MIKSIVFMSFLFILNGCSIKTPPNQWEHKSATAFSSYTKNFLSGNDVLARNDLSRAIKHAKKSADLTNLAKIHLGECALNISVGIEDSCDKYKNIQSIVDNKSLQAYYNLLTSNFSQTGIQYLPQAYKEYALSLQKQNTQQLNATILHINKTTSILICAALSKENIDSITRELILQKASYHGYKKAVLFWLKQSLKGADSTTEKIILKKIDIMKLR